MEIFANIRKDGSRLFVGKNDYVFIFGNDEFNTFQVCASTKEYIKKYSVKPTHSMIVEEVKAKRIVEAMPFMSTKHNMTQVFKLAEDM